MRHAKYMLRLTGLLVALSLFLCLGSCGTTRAHFGIDHDVAYNWNGGYYEGGGHHHHHHKHKKDKYYKHKHKKYKHYRKHHHDHDDDDD